MPDGKPDAFLCKLGNSEEIHFDDKANGRLPVSTSTENKHLTSSSDAQENTEVHSEKSFQSEALLLEKDDKNREGSSFDALEKCIEWLSHHPTDRIQSGQGGGGMQDVTKKNLLEYRQHAVLNWIATLPNSSSSSDSEEVNGLNGNGLSRRREHDSQENPTAIPSGLKLNPRTSLTQLVQSEGSEDESNWLSNIPILGRCCELFRNGMSKLYFREGSQCRDGLTKEEEAIKQQLIALAAENFVDSGVSESIPLEELSSGEARPRTGQDRRELRAADNVYFEEIQRLTNLLSNTPKPSSKMRTIFSLRKERILPEAPAPPNFINRVGRHVQGFFEGRFSRKRNRTNRVNPSHGSDRVTGQTATESTATRSAFSTIKNFFFKPTAAPTSTVNNEH